MFMARTISSDRRRDGTYSMERRVCGEPSIVTSRICRVCVSNMPVEHDGTNAFKFRVAFSDAITIGFRTFRDQSLTVTAGTVRKAKRVNKRRDLWGVTVEPLSHEGATVSLPPGGPAT